MGTGYNNNRSEGSKPSSQVRSTDYRYPSGKGIRVESAGSPTPTPTPSSSSQTRGQSSANPAGASVRRPASTTQRSGKDSSLERRAHSGWDRPATSSGTAPAASNSGRPGPRPLPSSSRASTVMSPELHLAVEAEERVRKEKDELLKAMAHQRRHFCTMEEKAEKRNQQLKELERSIEWKKQQCQAMMADIADDSRRRKEEEERRYAERLGIDENGNLVDSEEESYMEACVE